MTAGVMTAVSGAAALPVGLAIASGLLVGVLPRVHGLGVNNQHGFVALVATLGLLFLLFQLLPPVVQASSETLGRRVDRAIRVRVLAALDQPADVSHLEDPAVSDLVASVNGGLVGTGAKDAVVGMARMGVARGGPLLGACVLFAYRWWLGLVMLAAYSYVMIVVSQTYQRALESAEGTPELMRRATYLKDLACTPPAAKEVRTFGLADWLLSSYSAEFRTAIDQARAQRARVGLVSLGVGVLVVAAEGLTFALLAADVMNRSLSVSAFTVFAVSSAGLVSIATVTPDLLNIAVAGGSARQVRELERRIAGAVQDAGAPAPAPRHAIVFEKVGFRYPRSDTWVLRDLDLTIPVGSSLSIVGVNGAGKTTLVKLLCGLYQPTEGRILVDGTDLRELHQRAWQRRFAALFQDWVRWGLPLRDNVTMGAPERDPDPAVLAETANGADLTRVIEGLPSGWDTTLSREFDGVDISGGQWQRVGLARALWALSDKAEVLILDEPTSALDVRGELELFDQLLRAAAGKTIVLISHRFSTVRHADHIVVLADGKVLEQGDHSALMAADGLYAAMFTVQAERFAAEGSQR
jgi:ABC-type bacteriocin/lantibiotic exporter with double-glycine peptidase domain